jgi:hypothetical protein
MCWCGVLSWVFFRPIRTVWPELVREANIDQVGRLLHGFTGLVDAGEPRVDYQLHSRASWTILAGHHGFENWTFTMLMVFIVGIAKEIHLGRSSGVRRARWVR